MHFLVLQLLIFVLNYLRHQIQNEKTDLLKVMNLEYLGQKLYLQILYLAIDFLIGLQIQNDVDIVVDLFEDLIVESRRFLLTFIVVVAYHFIKVISDLFDIFFLVQFKVSLFSIFVQVYQGLDFVTRRFVDLNDFQNRREGDFWLERLQFTRSSQQVIQNTGIDQRNQIWFYFVFLRPIQSFQWDD